MRPEVTEAILGLSKRMLTMKAIQEGKADTGGIGEREFLILSLLKGKGKMTVSEIAEAEPSVSYSTISTDITRLWRDKKMVTKTVDPDNQRSTIIELTETGRKFVELRQKQKKERFQKLYDALDTTKQEEETLLKVINRAINYFDNYLAGSNSQAINS
jgi:DNA-binding MarR family transcriptional regulator